MLDHETGELTYSLHSKGKRLLSDDCDKIKVKTREHISCETDSMYTIMRFQHPVPVTMEPTETLEGVENVCVVGNPK